MFPFPSALLTVGATSGAGSPVFTGSYSTFTVPSGQLTADVTSFPVYVNLADMPSGFWSGVDSAGAEIRVTNSDGTVALPVDMVVIDTTGHTGHIFFKAALASATSNVFRIYYATGLSALASTDSLGRNAVWSAFDRVYDGAENVDRTGIGTALTLVGNTNFTSGQIVFDGVSDIAYARCSVLTNMTIFAVGLLQTGGDSSHHGIASYANNNTVPSYRNSLLIRNTGNWSVWNNVDTWLESTTAATFDANFTAANYHNSSTKRAIWANGVERASDTSAGNQSGAGSTPYLTMGTADTNFGQDTKCKLDLVALSPSALSSAYLAGLHNNRRNSGSFYSIV